MNGTHRADITPGLRVAIVLKQDQRSGKLTEGVIKDILTKSPTHPHGMKVRLENGQVGRVKAIYGDEEARPTQARLSSVSKEKSSVDETV